MKKNMAILLVLSLIMSIMPANVFHAGEVGSTPGNASVTAWEAYSFEVATPPALVTSGAAIVASTNVDPVERTNRNATVNFNIAIGITPEGRRLDFTQVQYEWFRPEVENDREWYGGILSREDFGGSAYSSNVRLQLRAMSQIARGGIWKVRVTLLDDADNKLAIDELFVTELTVRGETSWTGDGGHGNQNNQGNQNQNNQGNQNQDDQGENQQGGTTVVIVRPPAVVVNVNVTNNIINNVINQSVVNNQRPKVVFNLTPGQGGVKVSGRCVKNLKDANGSITIVHNHKTVNITTVQMTQWNVTETSEVSIIVNNVHAPTFNVKFGNSRNKPHRAPTPERLQQWLLSVLVEVNITVDGVPVAPDSDSESTVAMDVSGLNLTDAEKQYLKAVFFYLADPDDPDSLTYKLVEGSFDEDGYFHVPFLGDGWLGFVLGDYRVNDILLMVEVEAPTFTISAAALTMLGGSGQSVPRPFINPATGANMFSLRVITYALGGDIQWNAENNSAVVWWQGRPTTIPMNSPLPMGFGAPVIVDSRSFLPEAYLSFLFGVEFNWDLMTGNLHVNTPSNNSSHNEDDDEQ